jgi:hypothetical protein
VGNLQSDLEATVNVIHGDAVILDNSRKHSGIFIYDISRYVIGYVLGENTGSEIIILTNHRYPEITSYDGTFYAIENAAAFDCFAAECMDYVVKYEADKYQFIKLCSYISSPETDPIDHRNESNASKGSSVHIEEIVYKKPQLKNIFAAYSAHPNAPDFFDYDYTDNPVLDENSNYSRYLESLNSYYDIPLLITDTGIPSSRGISQVDLDDGYNRGGFTEEEQGEMLVSIIKDTERAGCAGVIINSFQDNWGSLSTANTKDYVNVDGTPYWQDVQSSDECFGIMEFIPTDRNKNTVCTVDGDLKEWTGTPIFTSEDLTMYTAADSKYLYIAVNSVSNLNRKGETLVIALDTVSGEGGDSTVIPNSRDRELQFPFFADFILSIADSENSYAAVQERNDIFSYRFGYYSNTINTVTEKPDRFSNVFNRLYQMNRYNTVLQSTYELTEPIFTETGKLVSGNADPESGSYNSLTDYAKTDNTFEIRIPWLMLNITDPVNKKILNDFYENGIKSERRIDSIGISAQLVKSDGFVIATEGVTFNMPNLKMVNFRERMKNSSVYIKNYWERKQEN